MSGAVILAGKAALKAGAGLLSIVAPGELIGAVQSAFPEAITLPFDRKAQEESIKNMGEYIRERKIRTVLAGNGLGKGLFQKSLIGFFLGEKSPVEKLVLDADGINNIQGDPELGLLLKNSRIIKILTPHIGEMARLLGKDNAAVKNNKVELARQFAAENNLYLVLKDSVSIIACPEGDIYISQSGSSSLAKGGSGDILAGLISGLWTSGYSPLASCQFGTYLLGRSGELYQEKWGPESALASDILDIIPDVFAEINLQVSRSA